MSALAEIARTHDDVELVYPVHLSPVVQECARRHLEGIPNVHLIAPLAADEMHNLMARCYLVLTDSGGLQEEAPALVSRCWCCGGRRSGRWQLPPVP